MAQDSASSSRFIALAVILGLASILAVLLRIVARRRSKVHLGFDDVFAVIALCGFLAFLGIVIWGKDILEYFFTSTDRLSRIL